MKTLKLITAMAIILALSAFAINIDILEQENESLGAKFEQDIPAFYLQNEYGKIVSLPKYADSKELVVIFTTDEQVESSENYRKELFSLNRKYRQEGYKVLVVKSQRKKTKVIEKREKITYLYLIDEKQKAVTKRMASDAPLAYVIEKNTGGLEVKPLQEI